MGQSLSFEVQQVTTDDYDKVMAIREPQDILNGKDYLRYSFHELINSPQNEGFSAVIRDQFVAFALVTLINDKTTIVMKSVRVHKSYSGQGIVRSLIRWIFRRYYLKMKVKRCWFASIDTYTFDSIQNGALRLVTLRKAAVFNGDVASMVPQTTTGQSDIQVTDAKALTAVFENDDTRRFLFPSDCLVSLCDPYQPISSNIPFIMTDTTLVLGSNMNCKETMILSCGAWFKAKLNSYTINIYGNAHRAADVNDHVITHVKNMCKQKIDGAVEIRVYTDEHVNSTSIYELFRKINVPKYVDTLILLIAEKNLAKYV